MPENHATLSASGSAKWLTCSASLSLEALIDAPDVPSKFSQEGTAAHEVLARCLSEKTEPAEYLGEIVKVDAGTEYEAKIEVDQEMVNALEIVTDYVRRLTSKPGYYEQRVDYSHIAPDGYGTADIILEVNEKISATRYINTLYVIDLKYGKGIKVDAYKNSQLLLYALGALNTLDLFFEKPIKNVVVVIAQPRLDHIDEYQISVKDLEAWGNEQKPKAEKAAALWRRTLEAKRLLPKEKNTDRIIPAENFTPSESACRWCQGRRLNKCKAVVLQGYDAAIEGFEDLTQDEKEYLPAVRVKPQDIKDPAFLTNADLAAVYHKIKLFKSFIEELHDEIARRLEAGQKVPGLKLLPGEGPRAWRSEKEEETIKALRTAGLQKTDYFKQSLISPTEAEKILKIIKPKDFKARYKRLEQTAVHRPPGKPRIVKGTPRNSN